MSDKPGTLNQEEMDQLLNQLEKAQADVQQIKEDLAIDEDLFGDEPVPAGTPPGGMSGSMGIAGGVHSSPQDRSRAALQSQTGGVAPVMARQVAQDIAADIGRNINLLMDVPLQVTVELGRTRMTVKQVLELDRGSVVELDRIAGEAVDVYVNERLIANGEVVVVDDKFGVRITKIINTPAEGLEAK